MSKNHMIYNYTKITSFFFCLNIDIIQILHLWAVFSSITIHSKLISFLIMSNHLCLRRSIGLLSGIHFVTSLIILFCAFHTWSAQINCILSSVTSIFQSSSISLNSWLVLRSYSLVFLFSQDQISAIELFFQILLGFFSSIFIQFCTDFARI